MLFDWMTAAAVAAAASIPIACSGLNLPLSPCLRRRFRLHGCMQHVRTDRKKLERLEVSQMEACCFNFDFPSETTLDLLVHLGKIWGLPKPFVGVAWKIACDA